MIQNIFTTPGNGVIIFEKKAWLYGILTNRACSIQNYYLGPPKKKT